MPCCRIHASASVACSRHGRNTEFLQTRDGTPFILCAKDRHLQRQQILDDLGPAHAAMNLREIISALMRELQSAPALDVAIDHALESIDSLERVTAFPGFRKLFAQVDDHGKLRVDRLQASSHRVFFRSRVAFMLSPLRAPCASPRQESRSDPQPLSAYCTGLPSVHNECHWPATDCADPTAASVTGDDSDHSGRTVTRILHPHRPA